MNGLLTYTSLRKKRALREELVSVWIPQSLARDTAHIFANAFGTFISSTSGYRFYTISDSTKRYYVDDSRGQYRYHPILFHPLSSTIDYLSTETFQFHVESTVWDYWKEDLLTMFCYFAPVIRHSVQTMCTMFSRKDFFRLFGGLLRISTRKNQR